MRSHVFSLCPDSHFALEQFRNCTAQSKNSYFARHSENSHFAQDNSGIVPILTLRRTYIYVKSQGIFFVLFPTYFIEDEQMHLSIAIIILPHGKI